MTEARIATDCCFALGAWPSPHGARARGARRTWSAGALSLLLGACGGGYVVPSVDFDADVPDATMTLDASVDSDTAPPDADAMLRDASLDAMTDADTATCPVCVTSQPCQRAWCRDEECVIEPVEDWLRCGADQVCASGECRARGCGDGLVEPGGTGRTREECDSGGRLSDLCDSECRALPATLPGTGRSSAPRGPMVGVDRTGRALVVWETERVTAGGELETAVQAARFDAHGASLDSTPIEIITLHALRSAFASVVGLAEGWLVITREPAPPKTAGRSFGDIVARRVGAEGRVGEPFAISDRPQLDESAPTLVAIGTGAIATWEERDPGLTGTTVAARFLDTTGALGGLAFRASPTELSASRSAPFLESTSDRWSVAWHERDPGASTRVVLQRFAGTASIDRMPVVVASGDREIHVSAASIGEAHVVAWEHLTGGNSEVRVVAVDAESRVSSTPLLVVAGAAVPTVAAMGSHWLLAARRGEQAELWLDPEWHEPPAQIARLRSSIADEPPVQLALTPVRDALWVIAVGQDASLRVERIAAGSAGTE